MQNKILYPKHSFKGNQYIRVKITRKVRPTARTYAAAISLAIMLAYVALPPVSQFISDVSPKPAYAPTIQKAYAEPIEPTATPTPSQNEQIKTEIKQVFGKDSDKAFRLLSCENSKLNPNAVNTAGNFPKGSRDIGVFQINEYWQKINSKFLFNPSINIRVAYQLFKENGNSFKLWTCGRKLGI